jgi:hypothetical protein
MKSLPVVHLQQILGLHLARALQRLARRGGCRPGDGRALAPPGVALCQDPTIRSTLQSGPLLRSSAACAPAVGPFAFGAISRASRIARMMLSQYGCLEEHLPLGGKLPIRHAECFDAIVEDHPAQ